MVSAERALLAIASGAAVAAIAYPSVRVAEGILFPIANPAAIVASARSELAWRVALAAYLGGMATIAGYAAAARSPAWCARWIARAIVAAAVLVVAQGLFRP